MKHTISAHISTTTKKNTIKLYYYSSSYYPQYYQPCYATHWCYFSKQTPALAGIHSLYCSDTIHSCLYSFVLFIAANFIVALGKYTERIFGMHAANATSPISLVNVSGIISILLNYCTVMQFGIGRLHSSSHSAASWISFVITRIKARTGKSITNKAIHDFYQCFLGLLILLIAEPTIYNIGILKA